MHSVLNGVLNLVFQGFSAVWKAAAALGATAGGLLVAEDILHPQEQPWSHKGWFDAYDVRRFFLRNYSLFL